MDISPIEERRQALAKAIEDLNERRKELEAEEAKLATELKAIAAYDAVMKGKPPRASRRPGVRKAVLEVLKQHPNGLSKGDLVEAMNAQDDDTQQRSISNALGALKRDGQADNPNGQWVAA